MQSNRLIDVLFESAYSNSIKTNKHSSSSINPVKGVINAGPAMTNRIKLRQERHSTKNKPFPAIGNGSNNKKCSFFNESGHNNPKCPKFTC